MAVIEQTLLSLQEVFVRFWESLIEIAPGIIAALFILSFGYFLGKIIGFAVGKLIVKLKIEKFLVDKTDLRKTLGKLDFAYLTDQIVKWYVFILFLTPAANLVQLSGLSVFLQQLALWIPNVILAVIVALLGYIVAEYISLKIKETKGKAATVIAEITRIILLVFVAIIALQQIGLKVSIAESSFLIVLAGIMLAVGLALGMGFGFAIKDDAKTILKKIKKNM